MAEDGDGALDQALGQLQHGEVMGRDEVTTQFLLTSLGSIGLNLVSMLIIPPVRELLSIGTTIFSLLSLFSCASFGIPFCAKKTYLISTYVHLGRYLMPQRP